MKRGGVERLNNAPNFKPPCFMTPCYKLVLIYPLKPERRTEHFSFLFVRWTARFDKNDKYSKNNC